MAFLAIGGAVHHIAGIGQRLLQKTLQIGIILDQQDSHSVPLVPVMPTGYSPCHIRQAGRGDRQGHSRGHRAPAPAGGASNWSRPGAERSTRPERGIGVVPDHPPLRRHPFQVIMGIAARAPGGAIGVIELTGMGTADAGQEPVQRLDPGARKAMAAEAARFGRGRRQRGPKAPTGPGKLRRKDACAWVVSTVWEMNLE